MSSRAQNQPEGEPSFKFHAWLRPLLETTLPPLTPRDKRWHIVTRRYFLHCMKAKSKAHAEPHKKGGGTKPSGGDVSRLPDIAQL